MSRRLVVAAGVAVLAALLPGTAAAEAENGTIVVEGRGGTTTEWENKGPLAIDVPPNVPAELLGGGPYAGALLEPIGGQQSPVGAVQVRAFADETRSSVARLGFRLEPGRYRVTLFGNGPVRVVLPNNDRDAAGIRIVPRTRIPVTFLGRSEVLDMGFSSAKVDLVGALPAGKRALQLSLRSGNEVGESQTCATKGKECEEPVLPLCLPAPAPCSVGTTSGPQPGASTGGPRAGVGLIRPDPAARTLLWSFEGYRDTAGKLRAAAIVF